MKRRDFIKTSLSVALAGSLAGNAITSALAAGPIKVGILIPLSGPAGLFGPSSQNCAQMAVDEINASGGILGRVTKVTDDFVVLEISGNLEIKLQKQSVQATLPKGTIKSI